MTDAKEVGFHFMLRTPARRARIASCLAFSSPNLLMENCFFRVMPSSGLHVARQYFRHGLLRRSIIRWTPWMPDFPRLRTVSAHQRRVLLRGIPNARRSFK